MHGFPESFNSNAFLGVQLEAVTYASNVIVLAFEGGAVISASAPLLYRLSGDSDEERESTERRTGRLVGYVSKPVSAVELVSSNELLFRFLDDAYIRLVDDDEHYESFLINDGEREFPV